MKERDERFGVSTEKKREARKGIEKYVQYPSPLGKFFGETSPLNISREP